MLREYEDYLKNERCMTPRSIRDYLLVAGELSKVLDILGPLTYKQVNDKIREMKENLNWSQGTVYKYSICVRHFFKWLLREQKRQDNPYPFSEWKKPRPQSPKFLTESTFQTLIDDPHLTHQEYTLLLLLWDSGARIGEIAALEQPHFDLESGIVTVPYEISKGSYSYRNVPITQTCIEALRRQIGHVKRRGHAKALFLNANNEPMTHTGLHKIVKAIGKRISPLRPALNIYPHMFRHAFGIRMLEKGVPQVIVQKWLGHQTLEMTSHYVHVEKESSRRIFNQYVNA